ncbi:hypothetical protein PR048_009222 [Dryococelus australis]|uniref:RING-type domain-containing protein n=1 Tax=Dryococelus australis TaxID=614101 RepID=A0ABQ9HZA2_9NEOP|nr:hypothetical protein PR048_009222 [Dryococelus australis]
MMPLVSGFSRGSPIPPPLHSGSAPFLPHFNLIGSQELVAFAAIVRLDMNVLASRLKQHLAGISYPRFAVLFSRDLQSINLVLARDTLEICCEKENSMFHMHARVWSISLVICSRSSAVSYKPRTTELSRRSLFQRGLCQEVNVRSATKENGAAVVKHPAHSAHMKGSGFNSRREVSRDFRMRSRGGYWPEGFLRYENGCRERYIASANFAYKFYSASAMSSDTPQLMVALTVPSTSSAFTPTKSSMETLNFSTEVPRNPLPVLPASLALSPTSPTCPSESLPEPLCHQCRFCENIFCKSCNAWWHERTACTKCPFRAMKHYGNAFMQCIRFVRNVHLQEVHEVDELQNEWSLSLTTDDEQTPPTKISKLDIDNETGNKDDHEDSIDENDSIDNVDDNDYDDHDIVKYDYDFLDVPTHFTEFPSTSDVKKAEDTENTDYMFTEDPNKLSPAQGRLSRDARDDSRSPLYDTFPVKRKPPTCKTLQVLTSQNEFKTAIEMISSPSLPHRAGNRWNERAGGTGDPQENLPANGIVRHDFQMRKS